MATATVEQPTKAELEKTVRARRAEIAEAESEQKGWQGKLDKQISDLGELQKEYNAACRAIATGKDADPQAIRERIAEAESRVEGIKMVLAERKPILDTLRQQLQGAHSALSIIEQRAAADEESRQIQEQVERGKQLIADRNQRQRDLEALIGRLRFGKFAFEANVRAAKNFATDLERSGAGILS
jgi:chromosome segregation ATPase